METLDGYLDDLEELEESGLLYFTIYYGIGSELGIGVITRQKSFWVQGDMINKIKAAYERRGDLIYSVMRFRVTYSPADNQVHKIVGLL